MGIARIFNSGLVVVPGVRLSNVSYPKRKLLPSVASCVRIDDPLVYIRTPRIMEDFYGGRCSIFCGPSGFLGTYLPCSRLGTIFR